MAWRPTDYLIVGELDNSVAGKVTGWMKFQGMKKIVNFNLKGDFHRDIRGSKIRLHGNGEQKNIETTPNYMTGFSEEQTGQAGDITAGLPPFDYSKYPYIEWYSQANGRCVIELEGSQVEILTPPIPWQQSTPIDRKQQARLFTGFVNDIARSFSQEEKKEDKEK